MTYQEILLQVQKPKQTHRHEGMQVIRFQEFSVLKNNDLEVIVDLDIAEDVKNRKWCEDSGGYAVANFNGNLIRLHDYVMAKTYGAKPEGNYIDHINQDKHDNRRINLRFVSPTENSMNVPIRNNNTSGFVGVSQTRHGTYRAYITLNKKQVSLGYYKTLEEAVNARREAETRCGFKTRPGTVQNKLAFLCELEDIK